MIVVDSNIIAYLHTANPFLPQVAALLGSDREWVAPVLWRSEFRNVLTGILRRGQICIEDARAIQSSAEEQMRGREYQVDSSLVFDLVSRSDCTEYDCEYVALAKQLGTMLVTTDRQILRAFPEVAVPLQAE